MSISSDSSSDVEKLELIWGNRLEFDQFVDKNIGHDTYETIAETILRQLNESNTSKCVQESSNSSVVQDSFDQDSKNQGGNLCAKHA